MYPNARYGAMGKPATTASSRAAARFGSRGGRTLPNPAPISGGAAWGYVSCRNALSDSGSLVTVSVRRIGDESLNPFTMQ
jgi:hypothetical protein